MKKNQILRLVLSALLLAVGFVLPFLTGQIPEIGSMLLPLHLPALLCGFVCGWPWGLAVGFLLPIVAILNYLIFFWTDFVGLFNRNKARAAHRVNPQTINFKKAQKEVQQRKGYLHKCSVCGVTDADNPDMEFRYCSKCNGYYCYCMDHINNHTHVQ